MTRFTWRLSPFVLAVFAMPLLVINGAAQQEVPMRGTTPIAPQGIKIPPLPDRPVRYETAEGQTIRVSVVARGFTNGWSMAFVDDDTILVAERGGAVKAVRNGVVDPQPVLGMPRAIGAGLSGTDLALHPDFARNRLVYISYTKPLEEERRQGVPGDGVPGAAPAPAAAPAGRGGRGGGPRTTVAVARAVWDGKGFTDAKDIFVGEGGSGGPIAFGGDGMLYVAHGGGDTQSPKTLAGKILRLTDEGKVPPDNPFVGRADARPEIFTMGHRTFLRMAKHPLTGAIWQIENGPNGGDEVNILTPGTNYGWPLISLGRTYAGPWQGPFTKEGFRDPIIYWMPAIAVSSITFYTGDRLPKWKGDVFVSGMRYGEIPGTGQLHRILINKNLEELRREPLLVDLRQRIRDVKQGRDGLLYVLTDGPEGAILRIEPAE
jgi:glucose/arabinose dehydrogenase